MGRFASLADFSQASAHWGGIHAQSSTLHADDEWEILTSPIIRSSTASIVLLTSREGCPPRVRPHWPGGRSFLSALIRSKKADGTQSAEGRQVSTASAMRRT